MKSPIILRIFRDDKLIEVKQFEQDQVIFGQEADAHIQLKDDHVSAIHCLVERRESGYYVCDLGSAAGTFKNGNQVLDEAISSGDQIKIGPFVVHFFVGVPKPKAPPAALNDETTKIAVVRDTTSDEVTKLIPVPILKPEPPTAPIPPKLPESLPAAPAAVEPPPVKSVVKPPQTPVPPKAPLPKVVPTAVVSAVVPEVSDHFRKKRRGKTFAPKSNVKLRESIQPGKGPMVEVIVAWKERVLSTYHFVPGTKVRLGAGDQEGDVVIPNGFVLGSVPFMDINESAQILIPPVAQATLLANGSSVTGALNLQQGDVLCISFEGGTLEVFVRYSTAAGRPLLAPMLDFSNGELTGVVVALVLVALTALYMSVYTPPLADAKKEDEQVRLAQFIYNKPKPTPTPVEEKPPAPPKSVEDAQPKPTPTPEQKKVVKVTEKKQENQKIGKKDSTAAATERPSARAAEVRPIPNTQNKPKKFTSAIKQGGSVKTSSTEGANAQSAKDVNKTGLLASFGGGGTRSKLDQAYSGAGDVIGMGNKATGSAGSSQDRAGDDLGSKFKDTGAGGKGTATSGISGIGTKGKSSGQSAYGGIGFGDKGRVAIDAGGQEAEFIGTIDREAVRRVIRSKLMEIKNCYERALNMDKSLEGKVVIRFLIEEQGRVRVATTKSTSLNNRQVEECVAARIKNASFPEPPPGTVAEVEYPFVFGSQN